VAIYGSLLGLRGEFLVVFGWNLGGMERWFLALNGDSVELGVELILVIFGNFLR